MNIVYGFGSYVYSKIWKKESKDIKEQNTNKKPKVILKSSKKRKRCVPKTIRNQVWRKYNGSTLDGKCFCCCLPLAYECWEAGHVISDAHGGESIVENLRPICLSCNRSMGKMNMFDFMRQYKMSGVKNI